LSVGLFSSISAVGGIILTKTSSVVGESELTAAVEGIKLIIGMLIFYCSF
jgi:hypothetical protein